MTREQRVEQKNSEVAKILFDNLTSGCKKWVWKTKEMRNFSNDGHKSDLTN